MRRWRRRRGLKHQRGTMANGKAKAREDDAYARVFYGNALDNNIACHQVGSCNGGVPGQPWSMPDCLFTRGIHSGIAFRIHPESPAGRAALNHISIETHTKAN